MTLKAEVLDALVAAGASAEMIVAAVKADMLQEETRRASKREGNAERQRRFKARRRGNRNNALPAVTPPIEDHTPPVSSDEETRPPRKSKAGKAGAVAKPDGVTEPVWRDFTRQRKTPVTPTALAGIEQEARKAGMTLNDALARCVTRGWQSFEADWVSSAKPPGSQPANDLVSSILGKQQAHSP